MKKYNELYVTIVKISREDVITASPGGGGLGGGFGGEDDGFDTTASSVEVAGIFTENA